MPAAHRTRAGLKRAAAAAAAEKSNGTLVCAVTNGATTDPPKPKGRPKAVPKPKGGATAVPKPKGGATAVPKPKGGATAVPKPRGRPVAVPKPSGRATAINTTTPLSDVACSSSIPPNGEITKKLNQPSPNDLDINAQLINTGQPVINETNMGYVDLSKNKKPLFINGSNDTDANNQEVSSSSKLSLAAEVGENSKNKSKINDLNHRDMTNNNESAGSSKNCPSNTESSEKESTEKTKPIYNKKHLKNKVLYIDLEHEDVEKIAILDQITNKVVYDTLPAEIPENKYNDEIIIIDDDDESENIIIDKSNNKVVNEDSTIAKEKNKAVETIKNSPVNIKNKVGDEIMLIDDEVESENVVIEGKSNDKYFDEDSEVARKKYKTSETIKNIPVNIKNKVGDEIMIIDDEDENKNVVIEGKSNHKDVDKDSGVARKKNKAVEIIKNSSEINKNKVGDEIMLIDDEDESENVVIEDKSNDKDVDEDLEVARKIFKASETIKNSSVNIKNKLGDKIMLIDDEHESENIVIEGKSYDKNVDEDSEVARKKFKALEMINNSPVYIQNKVGDEIMLIDEDESENVVIEGKSNDKNVEEDSELARKKFKALEMIKNSRVYIQNKVGDEIMLIDEDESENVVIEGKSNDKNVEEDSEVARKKFKTSETIKNIPVNIKNKVGDEIMLIDDEDESENVVIDDKSSDKENVEDSEVARKKFKTSEMINSGSINNKNKVGDQIMLIGDENDQSESDVPESDVSESDNGSISDSNDDGENISSYIYEVSKKACTNFIKQSNQAKLTAKKMPAIVYFKYIDENKRLYEQVITYIIYKVIGHITKYDGCGKLRLDLNLIKRNNRTWVTKLNTLVKEYDIVNRKVNERNEKLKNKSIIRVQKNVRTVGLQTDLEEDNESEKVLIPSQIPNCDTINISSDDDDDVIIVEPNDSISFSDITPKKKVSPRPSTSQLPLLSTNTTEAPSIPINSPASIPIVSIDLTENDEVNQLPNSLDAVIKIVRKQNTSVTTVSPITQLTRTVPTNVLSNNNVTYVQYPQIPTLSRSILTTTSASNSNRPISVSSNLSRDPNKPIHRIMCKRVDGNLMVPMQYIDANQLRPSTSRLVASQVNSSQLNRSQVITPQMLRTQITRPQQLNSYRVVRPELYRPRQLNRLHLPPVPPSMPLSLPIFTGHPASVPPVPNQRSLPSWKRLPPSPTMTISKARDTLDGFTLTWTVENIHIDSTIARIKKYEIFVYSENGERPKTDLWTRCGSVDAMPLPIAVTLNQFARGVKYYFTVRAVDIHDRVGPFSIPKLAFLQ